MFDPWLGAKIPHAEQGGQKSLKKKKTKNTENNKKGFFFRNLPVNYQ